MMRYLVTGGGGFIGGYLVRDLVAQGHDVTVLENFTRGRPQRLEAVAGQIRLVNADIRDAAAVTAALKGAECVYHLAAVNGTENFYKQPELVLDVGVRGILNVVTACRANGVGQLIVASSAEVYQSPDRVPSDEHEMLKVPDPLEARYSYGGSKLISELIAINYGRSGFDKVQIFRPHNIYGPDMGWKHVVPQFICRMAALVDKVPNGPLPFDIQGDGRETRAFCYVDDCVRALRLMEHSGKHLEIYHIGTPDEVSIGDIAREVARYFGREIELKPSAAPSGATMRRCPDISKMRALGYAPAVPLRDGIAATARWYGANPRDTANEYL